VGAVGSARSAPTKGERGQLGDSLGRPPARATVVEGGDPQLCLDLVRPCHNISFASYQGRHRTHDLLRRSFIWPRDFDFVYTYVAGCVTCIYNKASRELPYGLLQPTALLNVPCRQISMVEIFLLLLLLLLLSRPTERHPPSLCLSSASGNASLPRPLRSVLLFLPLPRHQARA
jgi:hypothetical protein